jgi:TPR repeat protein
MQDILERLRTYEIIRKEELEERFRNGEDIGVLHLYALENCEAVIKNSDLSNVYTFWQSKIDRVEEDPIAQNYLGDCLRFGIRTEVDYVQAAEYYKKSADLGDSVGQNNYGRCLEHGIGVAQNLEEAIRYYRLSSDQGNSNGQVNYGLKLIDSDTNTAQQLFLSSAEKGNLNGRCRYANFLFYNERFEEAMRQFKLALNSNFPEYGYSVYNLILSDCYRKNETIVGFAIAQINELVESGNSLIQLHLAKTLNSIAQNPEAIRLQIFMGDKFLEYYFEESSPNFSDFSKIIQLFEGSVANAKNDEMIRLAFDELKNLALYNRNARTQMDALKAIKRSANTNHVIQTPWELIKFNKIEYAITLLTKSNPVIEEVIDLFSFITDSFENVEMTKYVLDCLKSFALPYRYATRRQNEITQANVIKVIRKLIMQILNIQISIKFSLNYS